MSDNFYYEGFSVLIELLNGATLMLLHVHAQASHITINQEGTSSMNVHIPAIRLLSKMTTCITIE